MKNNDKNKIEWPVGGIWDGDGFDIEFDVKMSISPGHSLCKHAHSRIEPDRPGNYPKYTFPAVIIAFTEAGHASTGVCLYCVLDAVRENEIK